MEIIDQVSSKDSVSSSSESHCIGILFRRQRHPTPVGCPRECIHSQPSWHQGNKGDGQRKGANQGHNPQCVGGSHVPGSPLNVP